ncbi:copper resistance protein B [Pistricoccus aurantiacus]|uniref:Copper resistance protein B n=1 Tax=Pistricoccus aurantiacus TaxID=1883414 RepID=A0A5B8SN97_9GAMM|nr:copper resistance protein B [Pistricoccus aurantiacus]QEA37644.1 copper resistance protein B [Pistricoccus aurantiacus]
MLKQSWVPSLLFVTGLGLAGTVQADSHGKASLDSVVPEGPIEPSSGAPKGWKEKPTMDDKILAFSRLDRFEYGDSEDGQTYLWDAQGWIGGDYHKFWWETEGEGPVGDGSIEASQFEASYAYKIWPYWHVQGGVRYDTNPNPDRGFLMLGLEGLAPYWFETDLEAYLSEDGDVSASAEFEYDLLLTQRLVLQPRIGIKASAQDEPEYDLGSGITSTEMGLRLRYEIRREFAPYIGVRWDRKYGETKDIAEEMGEPTFSTAFVIGLRAWY